MDALDILAHGPQLIGHAPREHHTRLRAHDDLTIGSVSEDRLQRGFELLPEVCRIDRIDDRARRLLLLLILIAPALIHTRKGRRGPIAAIGALDLTHLT